MDLKRIEVVAAVIKSAALNENKIFAAQRGYGEFKGGWEFPGGKMEPGETPQEALVREIQEELDSQIVVGDCITTVEYDYPTFHLTMHCYWCELVSGKLELLEHETAKWLGRDELMSVGWLPADVDVVKKIAMDESMRQN